MNDLELLLERLAAVGSQTTVCETEPEAAATLERLVDGATVARWEEPALAAAGGSDAAPEEAELSLVRADVAVAESGSIGLVHGPGRSRRAALLPPRQVILLSAGAVVDTVDAALAALYSGRAPADVPSSFVFVTGPSRTRDIGLIPLIGVHAPKELHVVISPGTGPG